MALRSCPACDSSPAEASLFLKQNIDSTKLSGFSFASRKLPEFMCYELVRCDNCSLVYAVDPPDQSLLSDAYHHSDFDSAEEAEDAALTYRKALKPLLSRLRNKEHALEIGAGTGIFLELLMNEGFATVLGVEPSIAAISVAPAYRKDWIMQTIFNESDFKPRSFDLICCFMTLEHVRYPEELIAAASRLLRPGGGIALVTHDYQSWINRFLGRRSPIIDIEHLQLFSKKSIVLKLEKNNFHDISISSFKNTYSLEYWIRLLPIHSTIKSFTVKILKKLRIANIKITLNVGNILSFGFVPQDLDD